MIRGFVIFAKSAEQLTKEDDYSILRLLEAADARKIDLKVVVPNNFELVVTKDDKDSVLIDDKPTSLPDFVLPRMGAHTTYYAFSVIRQLEYLGVYMCNHSDAINIVKDKLYMHQLLARSKLPTPKTMLAKFPLDISVVKREIGFPLVIKNVTGTQGNGMYLCDSEEKFLDVMELIYSNNEKANIILQEFIQNSYGRDLRVFVVGGKVIGCMYRFSETSFKANFSKGAQVYPFDLTPDVEWLAKETAKLLNLEIAGVDLLFDKCGFKVCEANSSPDFLGLEKVVGKHIAEDIIDYIALRVKPRNFRN